MKTTLIVFLLTFIRLGVPMAVLILAGEAMKSFYKKLHIS